MVDPVVVGNHDARDDRLAEPPARLDHPLVDPGDGIPGKHDPRGIGIKEHLNDDANARARE